MAFYLVVSLIWIFSLWAGIRFMKSSKAEQKPTEKERVARSLVAGLFFSPGLVVMGYLVFPAPVWAFFFAAIFAWPSILNDVSLYEIQYILSCVVAPYLLVSSLFWLASWARSRGKSA